MSEGTLLERTEVYTIIAAEKQVGFREAVL